MMKAEKIRGIDAADIQRQVQDAQEQLFRLRFQMGMGQSEGLKKYRSLRKERARMLTVLREKEIGGETLPVVVTTAPRARKTVAPKAKRGLAGLFRRKK
jgi:large subunit ribosomal protein L29